jgi:hypothetical protein
MLLRPPAKMTALLEAEPCPGAPSTCRCSQRRRDFFPGELNFRYADDTRTIRDNSGGLLSHFQRLLRSLNVTEWLTPCPVPETSAPRAGSSTITTGPALNSGCGGRIPLDIFAISTIIELWKLLILWRVRPPSPAGSGWTSKPTLKSRMNSRCQLGMTHSEPATGAACFRMPIVFAG